MANDPVNSGTTTTRFIYDGDDVIAEYNGSNVLQRRYVHGPGQDNPLLWYEGTDDTNLRFFTADQQGSVTATTSSAGTLRTIYTYDEYGKPLTATGTDVSRFRYTGQVYLPEVDLYNYKARLYDPKLGRFLQTDPIGYHNGLNWYAYVGDDPVNINDPNGTQTECADYGQAPHTWQSSVPDPDHPGATMGIAGFSTGRSASGCHDAETDPYGGHGYGGNPDPRSFSVDFGKFVSGMFDPNAAKNGHRCGVFGPLLGLKQPDDDDGYYNAKVGINFVAGPGGKAAFYSGYQISNHVIVNTYSGWILAISVGVDMAAFTTLKYSPNPPETEMRLSLEAGVGPLSAAYEWNNDDGFANGSWDGDISLAKDIGEKLGFKLGVGASFNGQGDAGVCGL